MLVDSAGAELSGSDGLILERSCQKVQLRVEELKPMKCAVRITDFHNALENSVELLIGFINTNALLEIILVQM